MREGDDAQDHIEHIFRKDFGRAVQRLEIRHFGEKPNTRVYKVCYVFSGRCHLSVAVSVIGAGG